MTQENEERPQQPTPPKASEEFTTESRSQQRVVQSVQPEPVPQDGEDGGSAQVAEKVNEALEKGYAGNRPDPTPPENYTVQGVTSGAPRPDAQDEPMSPGEARGR